MANENISPGSKRAFPGDVDGAGHLAVGLEFLEMSEVALRHQEHARAGIYASMANAHLTAAQIAQSERHFQRRGM